MPRKRRVPQACIALAADGTRCGRYPKPGERLCSKHQPNAKPVGVIAQQDTDDLGVLLQRLTKDRDPSIRLRAIEARLKWEERQEKDNQQKADDARRVQRFLDALTPEERPQLEALMRDYHAIRVAVYRRRPDLMPDTFVLPQEPHAVPPTAAAADVAGPQPSAHVPEAETVTLTRVEDGAVIEEAISRAAFDAMRPEEIEP